MKITNDRRGRKRGPDLNDELVAGTLPADLRDGAVPMNERARREEAAGRARRCSPDVNDRAVGGTLPRDPKDGARPMNAAARRAADAAADKILMRIDRRDGSQVRVSLREWQGRRYVDLRIWHAPDTAAPMRPTAKGLTIRTPTECAMVQSALDGAIEELERDR